MVAELIDRRAVQVARHEEVGERDRQQAPQLLGVGPGVADRRRQERRQPGEPVERRTLGALEGGLDQARRGRGLALELAQAVVVRGALLVPIVQIDEAQKPVAGEQG